MAAQKEWMACAFLWACLVLVTGAPSFMSPREDPRHPGKSLTIPFKDRFDLLNLHETPSGGIIVQGDILIDPSRPVPNKFTPDPEYRWPEDPLTGWPVVPYVITQDSQGDAEVIKEGLDHWMENTCLTFKETTNTNQPHAQFIKGGGCYSNVGQVWWQNGQDISIGIGCEYMETVAHEVGHCIGFNHEQSRIDRDDSVKIMWENIEEGKEHNFDKVETNSTGIEYDYTSVMEYISNAFTSNGKTTMMPWNPYNERLMSSKNGLTFRDKLLANRVYGCIDKWESTCGLSNIQCANDGYVGVDCKCVCPAGTSGEDCSQVDGPYYPPITCGGNVTEVTDISSTNYPNVFNPDEWCMWWVQASEGKRARVTFHDFDLLYRPEEGICYWDHLEIRSVDPLESGDVFCEKEISPGQEFISEGQDLFIAFYGSEYNWSTGFSATIDFV
ncbi:unnamed protein product [Meganyctiphanes norvegica]|uniref:Metalloendopeptidase n=1 Tax=Meganyctiphanes norvegica TaxID=48144 RepID=A0AAV2RXD2_MEGNR